MGACTRKEKQIYRCRIILEKKHIYRCVFGRDGWCGQNICPKDNVPITNY